MAQLQPWIILEPWVRDAACKGQGDLFIAEPPALRIGDPSRAKQICAACPVQAPCLEFAINNREREGIWGGLTVAERWELLRQWRASTGQSHHRGSAPPVMFFSLSETRPGAPGRRGRAETERPSGTADTTPGRPAAPPRPVS